MIIFLRVWLISGLICAGITFIATLLCHIDAPRSRYSEYRQNGAVIGAALLFWPISCLLVTAWAVLISIRRVAPEFQVFQRHADGLSRRQRKKVAYQRELLAIDAQKLELQEQYQQSILNFSPTKRLDL